MKGIFGNATDDEVAEMLATPAKPAKPYHHPVMLEAAYGTGQDAHVVWVVCNCGALVYVQHDWRLQPQANGWDRHIRDEDK